MKRLVYLILGLLLTGIVNVNAQDYANKSTSELYSLANEYLAMAKETNSVEDYNKAIELYEMILQREPENYDVYVELSYCYLEVEKRFKAIDLLEKAVEHYKKEDELFTPQGEEAYYYLAIAYHKSYDFESACAIFDTLINNATSRRIKKMAIEKKQECQTAQKIMFEKNIIIIRNPSIVNTEYKEHSPTFTGDDMQMYFTSTRPSALTSSQNEEGKLNEDIYYIDFSQDDPEAINLGPPVNTPKHDASCDISKDGKELLIYRYTRKDKGDIYYSKKENGKWTEPKRLPAPINSKYRETHASFSHDGKYLFFTSNRPGGYGGLDIYVVERDENGNWTNLRNLGPTINTEKDEEGPFLAPDGKTLYFSSEGHETMGGFDVFKATWINDSTWSKPENMGFPLNTVDDDVFLYPTKDPNKMYYSSIGETGSLDIFSVFIEEAAENPIIVRGHTFDHILKIYKFPKSQFPNDTLVLHGRNVYNHKHRFFKAPDSIIKITKTIVGDTIVLEDSIYKIPAKTKIFDYNVATKKIIEIYNPTYKTGKYAFTISGTVEHLILYKAPNYIYDLLRIPENSGDVYFDAVLDTMIRGEIRAVKYTPFEPNNTELSESQKMEFLILADFMNEYPWVWVELSAYKDNKSIEPTDNQRLKTIASYLRSLGIDSVRIKFTYSDKPLKGDSIQYVITDIMPKEPEQVITKPVAQIKHGVLVSDIGFEINQYTNQQAYPNLDLLADYLKNNPSAKVAIYGYTDPQGPANFNIYLSKKRAEFVKNYLLSKGVNQDQIIADGKGFEKEIATSRDEKGNFIWDALKYNRRIEINVVHQGENELLFVKPIDVPDKYKVPQSQPYTYSIMLTTSDEQLSPEDFDFNVIEIRGADGSYKYFYGNFSSKEQAEQELQKILPKYPKAYIFINNFKK